MASIKVKGHTRAGVKVKAHNRELKNSWVRSNAPKSVMGKRKKGGGSFGAEIEAKRLGRARRFLHEGGVDDRVAQAMYHGVYKPGMSPNIAGHLVKRIKEKSASRTPKKKKFRP